MNDLPQLKVGFKNILSCFNSFIAIPLTGVTYAYAGR